MGLPLAGDLPLLMERKEPYDVAVIGGGLAGLAVSIELARAGYAVVVFEKEKFPFHKVCGEYVSEESRPYLESLGVDLDGLPLVRELRLTAPDGTVFSTALPLGGFGISRYALDQQLAILARQSGVHLLEEAKVDDVQYDDGFRLGFTSRANGRQQLLAKTCCGAFGKRSNLDVKWRRRFLAPDGKRLQNFVGVKYHVQWEGPAGQIALHNFRDGYCGISQVENGLYCLCYLVRARALRDCGNSIRELQEKVLGRNPHLRAIFAEAIPSAAFPVTISQIHFNAKTQVEGHVLMLGDAAGMITPLCGNGMSIALHTARLASGLLRDFLEGSISRAQLESRYGRAWKRQFAARLLAGRLLQRFFGGERLSNGFVRLFRRLPFLARPVIRLTHGKPF